MTVSPRTARRTANRPAPFGPADDRRAWRGDVQGIRALAVLMVVAYHAGLPVHGGFVGVDVFFVVSGFVIAGLLLRELTQTGRISFRRFYARRVRRLLPALATVSVLALAFATFAISPLGTDQPTTGRAGSAASVFFANGYFAMYTGGYFQPKTAANPFLHTWSLSVEEQFYVLFPISLLLVWRLVRGRTRPLLRTAVTFLGLSFCLSLLFTYDWLPYLPKLRALASRPDLAARFAFYTPVTRAWEFLAGVVVALIVRRGQLPTSWARLLAPAGLAVVIIGALTIPATAPFPGWLAALPVGGTALLIAAGGATGASVVPWLLSRVPLVRLGDWSYSWYLWHWPAIVFVKQAWPSERWTWAAAAFGSLLPAAVCYRLIEEPIRRRSRTSRPRVAALIAAVCIAVPAVGGAALTAAANRNWWNSRIAAIEAVVRPEHLDTQSLCASTYPLGSPLRPACVWTVPHSRGRVLLIGDSNAGQLSEPVLAAARSEHLDLEIAASGGCPFLIQQAPPTPGCAELVRDDLRYIEGRRVPYAAIIISNADVGYLNAYAGARRQREISTWVKDLAGTTARMASRSKVINVASIPQFADIPNCLIPSIVSTARSAGCGHLGAADSEYRRNSIVALEKQVVTGSAGWADLGSLLCSPSGCDVYRGSLLMYRDGAHLSVQGSLRYIPMFRKLLQQAVPA